MSAGLANCTSDVVTKDSIWCSVMNKLLWGFTRLVKCGRKLAQDLSEWMMDLRKVILTDVIPSLTPQPAIVESDYFNRISPQSDVWMRRTFRRANTLGGPHVCFTSLPAGTKDLPCMDCSVRVQKWRCWSLLSHLVIVWSVTCLVIANTYYLGVAGLATCFDFGWKPFNYYHSYSHIIRQGLLVIH